VSDNPYQSPAETSTADLSANPAGEAGQQRLGGLIWTVLILDCIPCLLHLYYACWTALYFDVGSPRLNYPLILYCRLGVSTGIAVFGLSGNTAILLKKRAGVPLAIMSIAFTIVTEFISVWMCIATFSVPELVATSSRVGWLILYSIVVWLAAKKLWWPRRNVSTR